MKETYIDKGVKLYEADTTEEIEAFREGMRIGAQRAREEQWETPLFKNAREFADALFAEDKVELDISLSPQGKRLAEKAMAMRVEYWRAQLLATAAEMVTF